MLDERLFGTGMIEAISQDGKVYHFRYQVETDELIFVEKEQVLDRVLLKPNPLLFGDGRGEYFKRRKEEPLIMDYRIDPEVVSKLVEGRKIRYSAFCADLYNLPREDAYDITDHKRDYKWSKNKEQVLARAKTLNFN